MCLCCSKCCLLFLLPSSANYYSLFICCCTSLEFKGVLLHMCSVQSFIAKPVLSGFCRQVSESGTRCLLPLPMNHTTLELICLVLGSLPQNHILSGLLGKSRWPLPQSSYIACLYWDCCPKHLCHHMLMCLPPTCSQFPPFHTTLLAPSSKCFDFAPSMLLIPLLHASLLNLQHCIWVCKLL